MKPFETFDEELSDRFQEYSALGGKVKWKQATKEKTKAPFIPSFVIKSAKLEKEKKKAESSSQDTAAPSDAATSYPDDGSDKVEEQRAEENEGVPSAELLTAPTATGDDKKVKVKKKHHSKKSKSSSDKKSTPGRTSTGSVEFPERTISTSYPVAIPQWLAKPFASLLEGQVNRAGTPLNAGDSLYLTTKWKGGFNLSKESGEGGEWGSSFKGRLSFGLGENKSGKDTDTHSQQVLPEWVKGMSATVEGDQEDILDLELGLSSGTLKLGGVLKTASEEAEEKVVAPAAAMVEDDLNEEGVASPPTPAPTPVAASLWFRWGSSKPTAVVPAMETIKEIANPATTIHTPMEGVSPASSKEKKNKKSSSSPSLERGTYWESDTMLKVKPLGMGRATFKTTLSTPKGFLADYVLPDTLTSFAAKDKHTFELAVDTKKDKSKVKWKGIGIPVPSHYFGDFLFDATLALSSDKKFSAEVGHKLTDSVQLGLKGCFPMSTAQSKEGDFGLSNLLQMTKKWGGGQVNGGKLKLQLQAQDWAPHFTLGILLSQDSDAKTDGHPLSSIWSNWSPSAACLVTSKTQDSMDVKEKRSHCEIKADVRVSPIIPPTLLKEENKWFSSYAKYWNAGTTLKVGMELQGSSCDHHHDIKVKPSCLSILLSKTFTPDDWVSNKWNAELSYRTTGHSFGLNLVQYV